MAIRYAALPHIAADMLGLGSYRAIADLYLRAHAVRYTRIRFTERELAEQWAVSGRRVWIILDTLGDLGLVEVEKGAKRKPSFVTVKDPTLKDKEADEGRGKQDRVHGLQSGSITGSTTRRQNSGGSRPGKAGSEVSQDRHQDGEQDRKQDRLHADALYETEPETEPETDTRTDLEPRPETEAEVSSPTTADPGKRSTEPIAKAEGGLFSVGPVKPAALPARQNKLSGKRKKTDVDPDAFDWLAKLWASEALETRPPGARPKQPPKYTATSKAGPTAGLKRLIRDVGEQDTALLIRWYWGGPDERGNREAGRGLITIARHSEEYITLASDWSEGIQPIKPRGSGGSWGDMLREELNKGEPNGL